MLVIVKGISLTETVRILMKGFTKIWSKGANLQQATTWTNDAYTCLRD